MRRLNLRIHVPGVLCLAAFSIRLFSQTFEAQITGEVKDMSGAVVPNMRLSAKNVATGTLYAATSNESGIYRFPSLPPAQYMVTCSLPGFKRFEEGPLTLQVNQVLEVNVTLQTGEASEQITVSAAPPALETETATLGTVVNTRAIQNLPLNIRDPLALVALTPGVVLGPNFGNGGGNDVGRNFFKSDFNVGAGRSGSLEILMDGAPDTTPDINRGIIDPPVDSVQEFKVQAQTYDAQFGRTSGAVLNVITKTGSNDYHGVAYDFERHSVLDANTFFNNRSGLKKPSFQRHQFGGNFGGPILKNKWFAFGDYEGLRQGYPITNLSTVPTALQRQGDFSQTFAANGSLIKIYDPESLVTLGNGTRQRNQFAGNVILPSRFDPVAVAALKYIPLPNLPGSPITGQNNFIYSANSSTNSDKYDLRTDVNFNEAMRMFVRFSRQQDVRSVPGLYPLPAGGGRNTTDHYTQGVADVTRVFTPYVVGDLQFSFSRALAAQFGASKGFNLSQLNLPASFIQQVVPQFPVFNLTDTIGTGNTSDSFTQFQPRNVWATLGSVSWQRGRHNLKFGSDWRVLDFNEGQNSQASGTFTFNRGFTQGPNPVIASATAGYGVASFLLGDAASGSVIAINPISTQGLYYALFVQDDWKLTDKLTLNLGLRWDVNIGDREKFNRLAYFDPTAPSSLAQAAGLPNLRGDLAWIGMGNPTNQTATDWKDFGPRFGFAYSLIPKTVLRGGYGIFYIPKIIQGNGDGAVEAVRTTPMVATIDNLTPATTISNPFPQGILPALNDRDPNANVGASIAAPTHGFRNGYMQSWSFGAERELPWGLLLDVHYWGMKGSRLLETWNIDQLPDQYLSLGSHLNDLGPNPFYGVITTGALAGSTISRQQTLLPFPQYTTVQQVYVPTGNSTYEAATIQLEKRLSSTLTFLGVYTRSKAIDDIRTPLDIYNRRLEKGLSTFDTPNQFRLSGVYNVPFGRDRAYGKSLNRLVNAMFADWDLNGIVTLQSGLPVALSRPSVNNGQSAHVDNPTVSRWFDTSVFSVAPPFTFGNLGPVLPDVRTAPARNVDLVVVKNFAASLSDHIINVQFRSEFYNLFNHPQFGAPNGSPPSQTFGQVTTLANNPRDIQFALKVLF
ncbi:MAG: TonB-dependent receptor [Acidobacteriaceae bacterium]|nr:TonB-dependent receptor [Acidobacteriaceae bacterium]